MKFVLILIAVLFVSCGPPARPYISHVTVTNKVTGAVEFDKSGKIDVNENLGRIMIFYDENGKRIVEEYAFDLYAAKIKKVEE